MWMTLPHIMSRERRRTPKRAPSLHLYIVDGRQKGSRAPEVRVPVTALGGLGGGSDCRERKGGVWGLAELCFLTWVLVTPAGGPGRIQ